MNKRAYRLIFDRRRNMRVAAAEHTTGAGKAAGGGSRAVATAMAMVVTSMAVTGMVQAQTNRAPVVYASKLPAPANPLPVPYGQSTGRTDRSFVANPALAPRVSWARSADGKTATFNQGSVERVVLNWDSFDIGAGYKVNFIQDKDPNKYVSALNKIWSADPSVILGSLTADREVVLLNANGVYFGRGAVVDTGKFVATSLNIADTVFEKGLRNVRDGSAVFTTAGDGYLPTNLDSAISVEAGAELRTAAGGDVLLIAPRVVNQGRIDTPKGQAVLAAGGKVYLMSSSDPAQRGLIVAVDPVFTTQTQTDRETGATTAQQVLDTALGVVENAARGSFKMVNGQIVPDSTPDGTSGLVTRINEMRADSGTVNLVGLTVHQNGNARATTAVKGANGVILLQSQESTVQLDQAGAAARGLKIETGGQVRVADKLGTVVLGSGSRTEITPAANEAGTQFAAEVFNKSLLRAEGKTIHAEAGAKVVVPSGQVLLLAAENAGNSALFNSNSAAFGADASRIVIDPGAGIDVSGLRGVELDGARNQGDTRLFRIELADAPVQRGGPLYRGAVQFDLRQAANITVGNVNGSTNIISRNARELSTTGGTLRIEGEGAVVVGAGSALNVSGGSVHYSEAEIRTSLLARNGRIVTFDQASPDFTYDALMAQALRRTVPAYDEGKSGGLLSVVGRTGYFGADLDASVVAGVFQRTSGRAAPAEASFGRLTGLDQALKFIRLADSSGTAPAPSLFAAAMDATLDSLPSGFTLSLPALQSSGLGKLTLRADEVSQTGSASLNLGVAGALDISARAIQLAGRYSAPGGQISLRTSNVTAGDDLALGDVVLGAGAVLSTAGLWTNDAADRAAVPAQVQAGAGDITVSAARSVRAGQGSRIDVSGGAWVPTGGKASQGSAGKLSLLASTGVGDGTLVLDGSLAGFDFGAGGTLTLGVPQLTLGGAAAPGFTLAPQFLSASGFSDITVRALGDVRLLSGTQLAPQLRNWQLTSVAQQQVSGAMGSAVVTPVVLDEALVDRKPVNLSLLATGTPGAPGSGLPGASVVVERGAGITLEAGGKLLLQAGRDVVVGATGAADAGPSVLLAPGGAITLRTTGKRGASTQENLGEDSVGFVPAQALWLGDSARLSVAGTAELRERRASALFVPQWGGAADAVQQVGTVLGGGRLTLDAARGYVVAEAGSRMNLDGFAAVIDLAGVPTPALVAKAAGTLTVNSPEGFVLDGTVSAKAPVGNDGKALADGGRLMLDLGSGGVSTLTLGSRPYPDNSANPREVAIGTQGGVLARLANKPAYGDDLDAALGNGQGQVSKALLADAGFQSLTVRAGDRISFPASVVVNMPLGVELDAPALVGSPGADVLVRGSRVGLGNPSDTRNGNALAADASAAPGSGPGKPAHFTAEAEVIDLVGNLGMQGFSTTALHADQTPLGEIRLAGLRSDSNLLGSLSFAGTLDLVAGQVYATSLSRFALNGLAAWNGEAQNSRVTVARAARDTAPALPFSAFGDLRITATDIVQAGRLVQPFGAISLTASDTLTLAAGSLTSVSGAGLTAPFGSTVNLSQWLVSGVSGELTALPVEKRVSVDARTLVSEPGATLSAAGGGDLQASEFFPGVGGTKDYLATAGLYAVLPGYQTAYAPRSEDSSTVAGSLTGAQIQITMAGSGLAPGRYTLLPARYALLADSQARGAFIVKLASSQGSAVLTSPLQQDDGSTVVTGYITQAGSTAAGQPGQRFVVEPAALVRARSETRLTLLSDLLQARVDTLGAAQLPLPRDGGAVQVRQRGEETSPLAAAIDLRAPAAALGGSLDIAAPRIALVSRLADTPAGALGVAADTLQDSAAGSVLLGGLRTTAAAGDNGLQARTVDTAGTRRVTVATTPGSAAPIEELLLAASEQVAVQSGSVITASGAGSLGAHELRFSGDGAVLAVTANAGLRLQRSGISLLGGNLSVGQGSRLQGTRVQLEATGQLAVDDSAALLTKQFALGARHIVVGDGGAAAASDTTVFNGMLRDALLTLDALELRSFSSIDFVGRQDFAARAATGQATRVLRSLVLDAPTLRGLDRLDSQGQVAEAGATDLAAQTVTLRNSATVLNATTGQSEAVKPATADAGTGTLRIDALPPLRDGVTGGLAIAGGSQQLAYTTAGLHSSGDIVAQGTGALRSQGDLQLAAARLTASSGAAQDIAAAGTLSISREAGARSLGERAGQGAQLRLTGTTITQGGKIDLPGGTLTLDASGSSPDTAALTLQPGSLTRAAGFAVQTQEDWQVFGDAGQINLRAGLGRIDLFGQVDVSAAQKGSAGAVLVAATGSGGELRLSATPGNPGAAAAGSLLGTQGSGGTDRGGRLLVDTGSVDADAGGSSSLRRLAELATQGGFTREIDLRLRTGDVMLDANVGAQRLAVTADQGSIQVGAVTLNADAPQGGELQLQARQNLMLADGAQLQARSSRTGANGGDVLLSAIDGRLQLAPGAMVDATGVDAGTGRIVLRAARGSDAASVNIDALNGAALRAAEVDIEAVKTYSTVTVGSVTRDITAIGSGNSVLAGPTASRTGTLGQASVRNDSKNFMASAGAVLDALGVADDDRGRVHLRAGVEVRASGNLTIAADWALQDDRPGDDAGMLTLRAAGNLAVNNSLSDGFTTATAAGRLNDNLRSWSMRLAAGADLGSADLLATRDLSALTSETGNLGIAAGKMVRTGAGSIALAAGRDIVFGGTASTAPGQVYVAGRKAAGQADMLATLFAEQTVLPTFSERGGNLSLQAQRNLTAPAPGQLINNWLWRSGLVDPVDIGRYAADSQLAWWSEFGKFQQTAASFGGGNVRVAAGGRITNLALMAPTSAWADSNVIADAGLRVRNGGDIDISAGGDITDGQFLLGRGLGRLRTGGSLVSSAPISGRAVVFGLMDGRWDVSAQGNLAIGAVFNPTMAPAPSTDDRVNTSGFFLSYAPDSSFHASSLRGDLALTGLGSSFFNAYKLSAPANASRLFQLLPTSLHLSALGGKLSVASGTSAVLAPSGAGQLQVFADGDISLGSNAVLALADSEGALPDASRPVQAEQIRPLTDAIGAITTLQRFDASGVRVLADGQLHGALRAGDSDPVRVAAGGTLSAGLGGGLNLSKPAQITAAQDIINISLLGQHHHDTDVTTIQAGRNILHADRGGYSLAGPGLMEVTAGRGVDLGASLGVTTTGNVTNASLASNGASLKVAASAAGTVNLARLDATYLQPAASGGSSRWEANRAALQRFVSAAFNDSSLGYDAARSLFAGLPAAVQASFARQILSSEFGLTYLAGTAPSAGTLTEQLRSRFATYQASILAAGDAALSTGQSLTLPGKEVLRGDALRTYLADLAKLDFDRVDVTAAVAQRAAVLATYSRLWRDAVAADLGSTASALDALGSSQPTDPQSLRYQAALTNFSGGVFERVRDQVVSSEVASTGAAASSYGLKTLPARMAFYDQGFQALELGGLGNFAPADFWPATAATLAFGGTMNMTQSSVITRRGGDIALFNPGGAINVGLKEAANATNAVTGVITLGGGQITGVARDDFQVNNQRVFVVGAGNMNLWSSRGDIDSGRGQNTAVGTPPLTARRSADGVVFEVPATTTGSGLGILEDAFGQRSGTIGLYPAFGEILALDAFIRAPAVVLGSSIKGADNLQAASVGGAVAVVSAPALSIAPPATTASDARQVDAAAGAANGGARQRAGLLTVDLLGLGEAPVDPDCSADDEKAGKCRRPSRPANPADAAPKPAAPASAPAERQR